MTTTSRTRSAKQAKSTKPAVPVKPAKTRPKTAQLPAPVTIPEGKSDAELRLGRHAVQLTNLDKVFWPELGLTKRDLLQYYADVAHVLLPHLADRAMVMKRYPNG